MNSPYDKEVVIGKLVPAKPKFVFNPKLKRRIPIGMNSGFPDFIAFKLIPKQATSSQFYKVPLYEIQGVECKMTGKLDKLEKEKCKWLIENNIFSKILIASKGEKKGVIKYEEFEVKK